MRLGIPEDRDSILLRSSLLDSLSSSSPWTPSSPPSSWSKRSGLEFPFSWITQQQQHQSPRQITADLLTQLLGQYFASQGIRENEILGNRLQEPYTRGQRPRANEQSRKREEEEEEEDLRNSQEREEDGGHGEEKHNEEEEQEFKQQLPLLPGILLNSQVGPRRVLRQKKEEETTNFIKKTLLPYPRLG